MTQLIVDILDQAVILAADRYQAIGGGNAAPVANRDARKLVSNEHLLLAVYGDWPIAVPATQPDVWLASWLDSHTEIKHATEAAEELKSDLEDLTPPCHVKGGGIIVASCTEGRAEVMEISGASHPAGNTKLTLSVSRLESPSGTPIAKGIFGSWGDIVGRLNLTDLPARTDTESRKRFLVTVIDECERAGITCILGPALAESRPKAP